MMFFRKKSSSRIIASRKSRRRAAGGPGVNERRLRLESLEERRVLTGALEFVADVGGEGEDYALGVATDQHGNTYATGYFGGTVDFDPTAGVHELTSSGADDGFVVKFDADGNLAWVSQFGSPETGTNGRDIAVDQDGNVGR